jgi:hypothetical protein
MTAAIVPTADQRRRSGLALALPALVVAGILGQFLFAGLALQNPARWSCHVGLGFVVAFLVLANLAASFPVRALAVSRGWILALMALYAVQITLVWLSREHGVALAQALHPFNGSLILVVALIVLGRTASSARGSAPRRR